MNEQSLRMLELLDQSLCMYSKSLKYVFINWRRFVWRFGTGRHAIWKSLESLIKKTVDLEIYQLCSFFLYFSLSADAECHAPPKQTASGNLPTRMSSFKKNAPRPHPVAVQPPKAPVRQQSIPKSPPRSPHRPVVEDTSHTFQHGSQTLGRHSLKHRPPQQQEESRNRTSSTGSAQHGLAKALLQVSTTLP